MTLLLAAAALALAAGAVVIQPIVSRRAALLRDVRAGGVIDAEARRRLALTELRELEYDYLGGKLDDADYQALRERLSRDALRAIRAAEAAVAADATAVAVPPLAETLAHACGFANPPGSRFCGGCGARLG